jgi:hypothetical protein
MEQSTAGGGAAQAASALAERAQQATGAVQDRAQQAAQTMQERVRDEVDRRTTTAGDQITTLASSVRRTTSELRANGQESQAQMVERAADQAERVGGYLRDLDADRLLADVEDLGRRQPMLLAGGGLVLGLLAARFLKASSSGRYQAGQRRSSYGEWEQQLPTDAQLPDATRPAVPPTTGTGLYGEPAAGPLPAPQPYPTV